MITEFMLFLCIGIGSGLLAGMFGIGGGTLIMPALIFTLDHFGLGGKWLPHIAIASSLATIIGTSISATWNHNKNHNVDWGILKRMVVGCIIGTFGGSYLAIYIPGDILKIIFALFLIYTGLKFIFKTARVEQQPKEVRSLPSAIYLFVGAFIGLFAALVGVGGGILVVPFLSQCGINMRKAIGTSAAFTLPVALGGTIGYIIAGWNNPDLPPYSFGFIYLPAVIAIMLASIPVAKIGVQLAQKLPLERLIKLFGLFLLLIAFKLIF
ncbi:sulfite exporter TauE/SafE family protein [Orbaceae bacterium ESL0721]|nr:sulfite exporter TauE/SafE family protein [Orbaceae bacterium ESL0721]